MLFYRRKESTAPPAAKKKNSEQNVLGEWLLSEIRNENALLNQKREEFETSLNSHKIECYMDSDFYVEKSVLNLKPECESGQFTLQIDKRNTHLCDLKEALVKYCTDEVSLKFYKLFVQL